MKTCRVSTRQKDGKQGQKNICDTKAATQKKREKDKIQCILFESCV